MGTNSSLKRPIMHSCSFLICNGYQRARKSRTLKLDELLPVKVHSHTFLLSWNSPKSGLTFYVHNKNTDLIRTPILVPSAQKLFKESKGHVENMG